MIDKCLRFNVDSECVVFFTADSLSHMILVGPSKGMPNIRSLYLKASTWSMATFRAMNSDPKVEVSSVFCRSGKPNYRRFVYIDDETSL